jgi:hypothetical protein
MNPSTLTSRVNDVDGRMEAVHALVRSAEEIDRDLASGRGTSYSFRRVQEAIEDALLYVEDLAKKLRDAR